MKLLNENKTYKYLKYAVGEIVLIITGILIAIQISNWNEDRKAQAEFDLYIVQLREDVSTTISGLTRIVSQSEDRVDTLYEMLQFLKHEDLKEDDLASFEAAFIRLGRSSLPQVHIGLLGRLIDGDLEVLSRSGELSRQALHTQSEIKTRWDIIEEIRNIMLSDIAVVRRYRGLGSPQIPDMRNLYDLDELRASTEFLRAAQNLISDSGQIGFLSGEIATILEDFLTVLEEYE